MRDTNTPALETERLLLRKFTQEDREAIFAIFSDVEANTFLPWFPLHSLEETDAFFARRYAKAYAQRRAYRYAICLKGGAPIGYVNVGMGDSHDFGYGLRKEFWRRGIVAEAGRAVVRQVKKDGLAFITATHDVKNSRSGSVMRRLGMRYCYSYQEQWQPKNILVLFRMYQLNLDGQDSRVYREYWEKSPVHFVEPGL